MKIRAFSKSVFIKILSIKSYTNVESLIRIGENFCTPRLSSGGNTRPFLFVFSKESRRDFLLFNLFVLLNMKTDAGIY